MCFFTTTGKPETPKDINIEEVTWDQITLTWIPGFNGGYDQTIVLEFTEILSFSKHDSTQLDTQREVRITDIPKFPLQQRCQISGLYFCLSVSYNIMKNNYLSMFLKHINFDL